MTDTNSENRTGFAAAFWERWRGYKLPFIATLLFGLAAHAFAMTNKLPFDDEAIYLFGKGTTTESGRYGLELLRLIMPDYSMPWIYGLISLLLISAAVCIIIKLFDIRSRVLQVLLGALFITFPAETGTLGYMFTAAPYALALFLSVAAVYSYSSRTRGGLVAALVMLAFSCSIYQGYFSFTASLCVLLMISRLISGEDAKAVLISGLRMLAMLAAALLLYGAVILFFSKLLDYPVLSGVVNSTQSVPMRIAVAYSAYIKTILCGYFGYVRGIASRLAHIVLLLVMAALIVCGEVKRRNIRHSLLLALCLFLFPLSCYCLYILADNGYIHALALYSFASLYILAAILIDRADTGWKLRPNAVAAAAMAVVIICNTYFANEFSLYNYLMKENVTSFYTSILTQVYETPGFAEGTELALIGEPPEFPVERNACYTRDEFTLPGNPVDSSAIAPFIIRYYIGSDIPLADDDTIAALMGVCGDAGLSVLRQCADDRRHRRCKALIAVAEHSIIKGSEQKVGCIRFSVTPTFSLEPVFVLLFYRVLSAETEIIGDHRDELRICGLALYVRDGVAEELLERLNISAVPCDLYGMANRALDARGSSVVALRNLRVEHLGHGIYHVHILDGEDDRLAQILIALYMCRHADLMDYIRDDRFKLRVVACGHGRFAAVYSRGGRGIVLVPGQLPDPCQQRRYIAGLRHEIIDAVIGAVADDLVVDKA